MTTGNDEPRGTTATRAIVFYGILAAVTIAVVVVVFNKGTTEKAQPPIAGGYAAIGSAPCLGPTPKLPPTARPLPPTAPAQPPVTGPLFNVLQSGQFVNLSNNQDTLGGQLKLNPKELANGGHNLTGTVDCVNGGSQSIDVVAVPL